LTANVLVTCVGEVAKPFSSLSGLAMLVVNVAVVAKGGCDDI
jgi:hypothetical protein